MVTKYSIPFLLKFLLPNLYVLAYVVRSEENSVRKLWNSWLPVINTLIIRFGPGGGEGMKESSKLLNDPSQRRIWNGIISEVLFILRLWRND